jgi:spermidine/putrescine-binding protein
MKTTYREPIENLGQDLEELKQIYDFDPEQEKKIKKFLRENKKLVQVLQEAKDRIKQYFQDENLYIEYEDGEEYEDGGELVLSIETKKDVKQALESLRNLKKGWWTDKRIQIDSKLSIDVRFIK